MAYKETTNSIRDLLVKIGTDLQKAENGNKAASQRVRTMTVRLEKIAKLWRKESIVYDRSNKGKKERAKVVLAAKKEKEKQRALKAKTKQKTTKSVKAAPKKAKTTAKIGQRKGAKTRILPKVATKAAVKPKRVVARKAKTAAVKKKARTTAQASRFSLSRTFKKAGRKGLRA